MSASVSRSTPGSAGRARAGEGAAWEWLQVQLAGRPVPSVLTIIGLGDLSLLEALDARAPATKVLALEPDPSRARETLAHPALGAWQRSGRLIYLAAPDYAGADQGWRVFPTRFEQPPLMVHPACAAAPGVRAALKVLAKIVFGAKANAEARRRFAPRYLLNSIRNLPLMRAGGDVRQLADCARGVPAVVVGAGPSLDRSLDDLARLGSRAIIVATDTALRPLLARGIAPQFVVALDPSEINARHLLDLPSCPDTWLVGESALDPRAAAAFRGRTLWFRVAPHQPWPWLNARGLDIGRLEVWGSVLTAGFQTAALAGCDPIVMAGADLSFPDGRPYVRGTTYEFDWAWAAAYGTPVEETWQALLTGRNDIRAERDLTGGETPTNAVMLAFRDWLLTRARKGGRRVVNATGRGMLFGDGVEQGTLSEVLADRPALSPLVVGDGPWRADTVARVMSSLRDVAVALAAENLQQDPLPVWHDFSGEGFDVDRLTAAIADASREFQTTVAIAGTKTPVRPAPEDALRTHLPEAASRLRSALAGKALFTDSVPLAERAARLVAALDRLRCIAQDVADRPPFVSLPEPSLVGQVAAGGIVMWPDSTRWAAFELEARLAEAWGGAVPPPAGIEFAEGRVRLPDSADMPPPAAPATHLYAPHGCVLLALEWLSCASSLGDTDALRGARQRLWSLQALLQRTVLTPVPAAPATELVLQATAPGRDVEVALPLGVCEPALARMLTGALRVEGDDAWELGGETIGGLTVRVALRESASRRGSSRVRRFTPVLPRRLNPGPARRLKLADQVPGGALCVVDFGTETVIVREDGTVEPYHTWPQPITGALSLGARGDVAWSNVSQPQRGVTPYLMYRPTPDADVVTIALDFRPARALWWGDRLYLTCLPLTGTGGGLASWAPGETSARIVVPDLPLQGLVSGDEALLLEPYVPGPAETVERKHAPHAWTWTPGRSVQPRRLGALGASSGMAVARDWTASAHSQADVIALDHRNGNRVHLRCYNPLRVAWAGDTLVVFAGDGELLLFERLRGALEVC